MPYREMTRQQRDSRNQKTRERRQRIHTRPVEGERRCSHEACTTVLSRFNTRNVCSIHERLSVNYDFMNRFGDEK